MGLCLYILGGIPKREPPSCEAPRQPTIYERTNVPLNSAHTWTPFHHPIIIRTKIGKDFPPTSTVKRAN